MSDIVERLRTVDAYDKPMWTEVDCEEAADLIEQQAREIADLQARLREWQECAKYDPVMEGPVFPAGIAARLNGAGAKPWRKAMSSDLIYRTDASVERMGEALSNLSNRMRETDFIHCDSNPITDANASAYEAVGKAWDKLTADIVKEQASIEALAAQLAERDARIASLTAAGDAMGWFAGHDDGCASNKGSWPKPEPCDCGYREAHQGWQQAKGEKP